MHEAIETEIRELHAFFRDWFSGNVEQTEEVFSRVPSVLAEGFELINPLAHRISREGIINWIRGAHGSRIGFKIGCKNIETRALDEDLFLSVYEEWQILDSGTNGRQSTAIFRRNPDCPNGVEWLHVHETAIH
jgi:hypothetical protein